MSNSHVYIVSDDSLVVEKVKSYLQSLGVNCSVHTQTEWQNKEGRTNTIPALSSGASPVEGAKVLQFPTPGSQDGHVSTMNEVESKAIETAILQFRGNLTEAAKALGIGRATLYRKVKQYNIDPSFARRKRAA